MLKKAVLLLNMGGPGKLEEVEIFLKNMFNDPFILSIKSSFCRKILAFIITFFRKKKSRRKLSANRRRIADKCTYNLACK